MKKNISLALIFLASVIGNFLWLSDAPPTDKAAAEVNYYQGFYVFTDAEPRAPFKYLGTVETGPILVEGNQYQQVRDRLARKARKKFPEADGLILHFSLTNRDGTDVIKFE